MAEKISLAGLNKADVLAALYNASKPQGMGFLQYDPKPMTREEAEALLKRTTYFDYLKGRVMKLSLADDELDPSGYDRDNGQNSAKNVIDELRKTSSVNPLTIQARHHVGTLESAEHVRASLHEEGRLEEHGEVVVVRLGLADVADKLGPAVDRVVKACEA